MLFPKPVYFILGMQYCENFCYYGVRTILFLYLIEILRYPKDTATIIFHVFTMLIYCFPIISAIVADTWFGKYRTILYTLIVYIIGQTMLSISSVPSMHLPVREVSLLGMFLIALGTGGVRPCVPPFGAEQYRLPEQESQLSRYFTAFFIANASGALIAIFIAPILRKDVTCFGFNACYPLAFLVPSIFMILALVIFLGGSRMFRKTEPQGNVLLKVATCICYAIKRKICSNEKKKHWLDYAKDAYGSQVVDDTKTVLSLIKLLIPMTIFYSLIGQISSRWTYQATRMDGETFGYQMKPDHVSTFCVISYVAVLGMTDIVIYPIIGKFLFINTPLRKMAFGGIICATTFMASGLLEFILESTYVIKPSAGSGQIRIFNTINCPADLSLDGQNYKLEALGLYQNLSIPVIKSKSLQYDLKFACPFVTPSKLTGRIDVLEEKALSYLLKNDGLSISLPEEINKSESGNAMVRAIIIDESGMPANLSFHLSSSKRYILVSNGRDIFTNFIEVNHNNYNISVGKVQLANDVSLRSGGVYTILGQLSTKDNVRINTVSIVEPNSIHMLWLLPLCIIFNVGEVTLYTTATKFAYIEAPESMKTVSQALWFSYESIGNLIVVIITQAHFFNRQVFEFFLYATLMYIGMLIFISMAVFYKYADNSVSKNSAENN